MRGRQADGGNALAAVAPRALAVLCCGLAAWSALGTWRAVSTQQAGAPAAAPPPAERRPALAADVGAIVDRHLFGSAAVSQAQAPQPTRAALVLGGVWYAPAGDAYALIGEPGAPQKPYRTGDRLPGGAELAGIEAARVLLRRDGQTETLALPRAPSAPSPTARARRSPAPLRVPEQDP